MDGDRWIYTDRHIRSGGRCRHSCKAGRYGRAKLNSSVAARRRTLPQSGESGCAPWRTGFIARYRHLSARSDRRQRQLRSAAEANQLRVSSDCSQSVRAAPHRQTQQVDVDPLVARSTLSTQSMTLVDSPDCVSSICFALNRAADPTRHRGATRQLIFERIELWCRRKKIGAGRRAARTNVPCGLSRCSPAVSSWRVLRPSTVPAALCR